MALTRILLWLGNSFVLSAIILAITAFAGALFLEIDQAITFAILAILVGILGALLILLTHNTPSRETNADALLFLILFWLIMPLVTMMPFIMTGEAETFVQGYFESVSAITTTGASTLSANGLSRTLLFWRSLLQWFGGLSAATFAVVILAALNLSGTGIHRSMLFTLKKGELFQRLIGIGRVIAILYFSLSALCFIGLALTGTPLFEALCLSLTSISTGGLTPRDGPLAAYVGPIGSLVLAVFCMAGAFSIAVVWDFVRTPGTRGVKPLYNNVEHRGLFVIIGLLIVLGIIFALPEEIATVLPEAIYFATSTGYDYHVIGIDMIPATPLIAIALIGGAALSTAGGVKIIRLLLLFRHLGTYLGRLSHPSRTIPVSFRGNVVPDRAFLSIWMYFLGFTLAFSAGIVLFGVSGIEFETAVAASAASIANMGPLLDTVMTGTSFADFKDSQLLLAASLMLVGRIEVLAAFAGLFSILRRH